MCRVFLRGKHSAQFCCLLQTCIEKNVMCTEAHFSKKILKQMRWGKHLSLTLQVFLFHSGSEMSGIFHASFLLSFMLHIIIHFALQQHQSPFSLIIKTHFLHHESNKIVDIFRNGRHIQNIRMKRNRRNLFTYCTIQR